MSKYTHKIGSIKNYIQQIYVDGLKKAITLVILK